MNFSANQQSEECVKRQDSTGLHLLIQVKFPPLSSLGLNKVYFPLEIAFVKRSELKRIITTNCSSQGAPRHRDRDGLVGFCGSLRAAELSDSSGAELQLSEHQAAHSSEQRSSGQV